MMAKKSLLLFVLAIGLSPVIGYICSVDKNSPRDAFEYHGCSCGTDTVYHKYPDLFFTYEAAFRDCRLHENSSDTGIDVTIDCTFKESVAYHLKDVLNRTSLSEIPVFENGSQIYRNVTCL